MGTDTKKIWPMPEILKPDGKSFTIKESPRRDIVCTELNKREMFVPTGNNDADRMSRLHEMGHVAFTPEELMQDGIDEGISSEYLNVAEDLRINKLLKGKFDLVQGIPTQLINHAVEGAILNDDFKSATLMFIACGYLPEQYKIAKALKDTGWDNKIFTIERNCEDLMQCENWSSSGTIEAAKYLQSLFEDVGNVQNIDEYDLQYNNNNWETPDIDWGEMHIITPPLHHSLMQRRQVRRITPKEHGTGMMFPTRLDHDDKIFGNTKRVVGGTVLIDVSSSMGLDEDDIRKMVKAAPGLTSAIYSGRNHEGDLVIVAKKGKMTELKTEYINGNNVIDGPALRWLATMPEPRIWICDGYVTGIDDLTSLKLKQEVKQIVKDHDITRVEDIKEAIHALKK